METLMVVLVFIAVAAVVFLLNTRDAKSWVHGILMTLWQSMIFIAVFFFLIYLSDARKKNKKRG